MTVRDAELTDRVASELRLDPKSHTLFLHAIIAQSHPDIIDPEEIGKQMPDNPQVIEALRKLVEYSEAA